LKTRRREGNWKKKENHEYVVGGIWKKSLGWGKSRTNEGFGSKRGWVETQRGGVKERDKQLTIGARNGESKRHFISRVLRKFKPYIVERGIRHPESFGNHLTELMGYYGDIRVGTFRGEDTQSEPQRPRLALWIQKLFRVVSGQS